VNIIDIYIIYQLLFFACLQICS